MKSPLSGVPAFFILFACVSTLFLIDFKLSPGIIPIIAIIVTGGLILLTTVKTETSWLKLFLLIIIVSLLSSTYIIYRINSFSADHGYIIARGLVIEERPWGSKRVAVFKEGSNRFLLKTGSGQMFRTGQKLEIRGLVMPLEDASKGSNSKFNEKRYWLSKNVGRQIVPYEIEKLENSSMFSIARWRGFLRKKIDLNLPSPLRGYILASWLGISDPELREMHSRWGTSHLLAVSGFHVGIVAALMFILLRSVRNRALLVSIFIWMYVVLTGFHASAFRAGIMIQLLLLGEIIGRPINPLNSVSVAAVLMLLFNPWFFWDIGWKLSVISVMAIVSTVKLMESRKAIFAVSPVAWIVTYPVVSATFGSVPVSGIVINLAAVPAFAFVLPFLSVSAAIILSGSDISGIVVTLTTLILNVWEYLCNQISSLVPYSLNPYVPLSVISVNFTAILVMLGMEVPWKRVMLVLVVLNSGIPFISSLIMV